MPDEAKDNAAEKKRDQLHFELHADPATDGKAAREVHGLSVIGAVYINHVAERVGEIFNPADDTLRRSAMRYVRGVFESMAPRDAAEEMLVGQLVLTHARVLHLTDYARGQGRIEGLRVTNEYADRASNTFRRLMMSLAEYRRPPRPVAITAINQTNIAGQQVIQNENSQPGNATNEQGCDRTRATPALSADTGGIDFAAEIRAAREAVAVEHRTPNA